MININGKQYSGNNLCVSGNRVYVDGKEVEAEDQKTITIVVDGNIEQLSVDSCKSVEIKGNVHSVKTVSGDVRCGNVCGSVQTVSGDVRCPTIGGNATTVSGDIG